MNIAASTVIVGLGVGVAVNEYVVHHRAERLQRLRRFTECRARRVVASEFSMASFDAPVVMLGLLDDWPARRTWSFDTLRARIGQRLVDIGSIGSDGIPFYAVAFNAIGRAPGRHDLSLYVFDADFSEASGKASFLDDWRPLDILTSGDVFSVGQAASHPDRPDYRWLLAGPPGSGSPLHRDPWAYSSWNASLVGAKRWVLFPPDTPTVALHPPRSGLVGQLLALFGLAGFYGAAEFMDEVLPTLRDAGLGHVELIQRPGEVVAFPANWWHAVVNLDATLAVTESFGEARNLEAIVAALLAGRLGALADVIASEAQSRGLVSRSGGMTSRTPV